MVLNCDTKKREDDSESRTYDYLSNFIHERPHLSYLATFPMKLSFFVVMLVVSLYNIFICFFAVDSKKSKTIRHFFFCHWQKRFMMFFFFAKKEFSCSFVDNRFFWKSCFWILFFIKPSFPKRNQLQYLRKKDSAEVFFYLKVFCFFFLCLSTSFDQKSFGQI